MHFKIFIRDASVYDAPYKITTKNWDGSIMNAKLHQKERVQLQKYYNSFFTKTYRFPLNCDLVMLLHPS